MEANYSYSPRAHNGQRMVNLNHSDTKWLDSNSNI